MTDLQCEVPASAEVTTFVHCRIANEPMPTAWGLDATAWTMVTAVASIALAIFALLAWQASTKTLHLMRSQERTTADVAESQIADQKWGRQVDALARYTAAIIELRSTTKNPGMLMVGAPGNQDRVREHAEKINRAVREIKSSGLIWRLQHVRENDLVWELEHFEGVVMVMVNEARAGNIKWSAMQEQIGNLLDFAEAWQEAPDKRKTTAERVKTAIGDVRSQLALAKNEPADATRN